MDSRFLDETELELISTITSPNLRKITFNNANDIRCDSWVQLDDILCRMVNGVRLNGELTVEVHAPSLPTGTSGCDRRDFFRRFLQSFRRGSGGRVEIVETRSGRKVIVRKLRVFHRQS